MLQPPPTPSRLPGPRVWRSVVLGWPGLLTVLSLLAVLLGHQPHPTEPGKRLTAGNVTPALPEIRPAPQPLPGPALPAGPPPEPWPTLGQSKLSDPTERRWTAPTLPRTLALLGRRQTDGG